MAGSGNTQYTQGGYVPTPTIPPTTQPVGGMRYGPSVQPYPAPQPTLYTAQPTPAPPPPAPALYTPQPYVAPPSPVGSDVMTTSANLYNTAAAGPNIDQFMNPYTQSVVDANTAAANEQIAMQQNALGAQADAAGAFGGSRHGVAEGQMIADSNSALAAQNAALMSQGYTDAVAAAQAQQQIQSGLAGQGYGFGMGITNQQMQYGTMQQQLMQDLIDASKMQYAGYAGAPLASMQAPLAALSAANMGQQTSTTTQDPGLFNYFSLGLGLL